MGVSNLIHTHIKMLKRTNKKIDLMIHFLLIPEYSSITMLAGTNTSAVLKSGSIAISKSGSIINPKTMMKVLFDSRSCEGEARKADTMMRIMGLANSDG